MAPLLGYLVANGLPLLANALMSVGKAKVEEKLGVKIPDLQSGNLTPEQLFMLKKLEAEQPEKLLQLALEEKKLELQDRASEQSEITKRWQEDSRSDSRLAKNVRPATLVFLLLVVSLFAFGSGLGFDIAPKYIDLFEGLLQIVFVAYFGSRGIEKLASIVAPVIKERRK